MATTKKVLFVATITGHINAFHIPYLKLFKDKGYEVHVATGDDVQIANYCDKKIIMPIARSPYKISNIKAIRVLKENIMKEKYDIIHCHTPMGAVVTRLAAKKARKKYGTKVIYTAHGFHFYKGAPKKNWLLYYPVEWYLAKYTDTLITINKNDYNFAKKKFIKRCLNIIYVPGVGLNFEKFNINVNENEKNSILKSLNLKKDAFILVFPARLDKNKNQIFLINCMEKLIKVHKNIHLLLPGSDELNGYYQNNVKERNLCSNIHFLGRRNDIPELLKISNISVSSSLREGLPVNVMEAFACGLPVVALNCRGMEDLVENDINGYVIDIRDNNNINDFANKILYLYDNSTKIKEMGINNLKKVKNFSIDKILKEFNHIYFN